MDGSKASALAIPDTLLYTPRELVRELLLRARQVDKLKASGDALLNGRSVELGQFQTEPDVPPHRLPWQETALLEDYAESWDAFRAGFPIQLYRSAISRLDPRDDPQ